MVLGISRECSRYRSIRVEVGISANRPAKRPDFLSRFHVPDLSKPIPMLIETKVLLVFTSSTIFLHNDPNQNQRAEQALRRMIISSVPNPNKAQVAGSGTG
jgi:hypothetical protein